MLTLYHFILTKGYAPLRRGGMRSLGDGKGGWSEGSRSCSAWTEDVPSDVGALEPLPPQAPWSLCPCCCSAFSGGSLQRALLWRGGLRGAEVRRKQGEGSLHPPVCSLGALCSDAAHRPSAGGVGFAWATPLQRVWNATEPPHPRHSTTVPDTLALSHQHLSLEREKVPTVPGLCAAAHISWTSCQCSCCSSRNATGWEVFPQQASPCSPPPPLPQNFSEVPKSAGSGHYRAGGEKVLPPTAP